MIKVLIIEDEAPARKKLKNYLDKCGESIEIIREIETVKESIEYLETEPELDIIFSDIELRDGNVFEVYKQLSVSTPIIFATAYDQFWMDAFETNGIEYLLKPYSYARFEKAWNKYKVLKDKLRVQQNEIFKKLDAYYQSKVEVKPVFKDFIPVKSKSDVYFLKVADISFIQADYGVVFAFDCAGKRHILNQSSLKELQEMLNPDKFFKINRSELVNRNYIEKINRYTKNTVAVYINGHVLKTSQGSTADFNSWMGL